MANGSEGKRGGCDTERERPCIICLAVIPEIP